MSKRSAEDGPKRPSLAPRNWVGWMMVVLIWVLGHLPMSLGRLLVWPLALVMRLTLRSRRRIASRNLEICFPDWSKDQREAVLHESFISLARALMEMTWCWATPVHDLQAITTMTGEQHLLDAMSAGKGVLIVTGHFSCLEVGARTLGERQPGSGIYRPLKNPVVEWFQNRARSRYTLQMIRKRDMRRAVRCLRKGEALWYAPDQDFGPDQSEFAPFFGVPTATLLATHRLPIMTGCKVLTMFPRYHPDTRRYEIEISPALEDYPTDDPVADLSRINALLEAQVRQAPGQYWWVHRRFKTRPEGAEDIYGADGRQSGEGR